MSKKHMARPEQTHVRPRSDTAPVPELQGGAKHHKEKANPIIAGTAAPAQKVYHARPYGDRPISDAYSAIDNDLARDNLENDIPAADLEDLRGLPRSEN